MEDLEKDVLPQGIEETDNSQDSSSESNDTENTQSDEGDKNSQPAKQLPFHEDPKIQEYLDRQFEAREQKIRDEIRKENEERFKQTDKKVEIPSWFGGDEEAWNQYQLHLEERDTRVRAKALEELQGLTAKEQAQIKEANDWFDSNVKEIEKEEGFTVDRNVLLKTAQEFRLLDDQQRWNWKAAWRIAKQQYKADPSKVDQRKKIVSMDDNDRGEASGTKSIKTPKDFQKSRPW